MAASSVLQCRMEPLFLCPYAEKTGIEEGKRGKSFPTMVILWIVPAWSCAPLQRNQYGRIWK